MQFNLVLIRIEKSVQLVRVARLIAFVFPPLSSRCSPIVDVIAFIVLNLSQHERLFFQCIGSVNVSTGAKALEQNLFTLFVTCFDKSISNLSIEQSVLTRDVSALET